LLEYPNKKIKKISYISFMKKLIGHLCEQIAMLARLLVSISLFACVPSSWAQTAVDNTAKVPSLGKALAPYFPFGAAITPGQVLMSQPEFIKEQFTVVVAENAMKPELLAKEGEGKYDFENADDLVNFALANNMKVRGHTLIWHQQMPGWFFSDNGQQISREKLIVRMEKYITDVVTHFKGRVYAWDVVNEAFVFGEPKEKTDDNGMRMSRFREIIGPEYMEIAFRAAAKADPNALLFYNDYETQSDLKVKAISTWVREMQAKKVKIDGIGHQAHYTVVHPDISVFEDALLEYAKLGLTQHITEMDIALNDTLMQNKVPEATAELLQKQADRYAEFFRLFIKHRQHVTAVLLWGIGDAFSWLKTWPMRRFEAPLLFDEDGKPKPAFWAVHKLTVGK
jgi:endo-1,4-beta-xylanase